MRVLLTGATGYFGRHVLLRLQQSGISVVTIGRVAPEPELLRDSIFLSADLLACTDWRALMEAAQATHLVHVAWYTEYGKFWESPLNLRWLDASMRLAQAFCETGGQHVLMAGTCAEYDWSHGYCREDTTPLLPETLYGVAKDATRRVVAAICAQHRVPFAWGRLFYPYGFREVSHRLVPSLVNALKRKRPPFGVNVQAYRDFLAVDDAARGFVCLAQQQAVGAFNVSSGDPVQVRRLICQIAQLLNADPVPILSLESDRRGEPALLVGESLRLRALGWQPQLTLEQGLEQMLFDFAQSENTSTYEGGNYERSTGAV